MYRADGPDEFKVVGETEFVQGIAAMSASGRYGETRVAAGIVGTADLLLGDRVAPALEAKSRRVPSVFAASVIARRGRIVRWFPLSRPISRNMCSWTQASGEATPICASTACHSRGGSITRTLPT